MSRPRKKKPMTLERAERALDILAGIMANAPRGEGVLGVPLWQRFEKEIAAIRDQQTVLDMAINRAKSTERPSMSRPCSKN